jgi:hypothetical protein
MTQILHVTNIIFGVSRILKYFSRMSAVITKKQKNTIMVLGSITAVFGAAAGACGLLLRGQYLTYDQDWDVDIISGFTDGYFGVMSGFLVSSSAYYQLMKNKMFPSLPRA